MSESRRAPERWKVDDDITALRLQMMQDLAESAQLSAIGKNVRLYKAVQGGTAIAVDETPSTSRQPLVKITGSATGGGKYTGTLWTRPTVDIPETGNLTEAELGITGDEVRIVNPREVGLPSHDLSSPGFLPTIFPATFLKTADDNVPVYVVGDPRPGFLGYFAVTSATQDGSNKRWTYAMAEHEKVAAGYAGWTVKSGGVTIATAYNFAEEDNGATGLWGNGVSSTNLTGTLDIMPAPTAKGVHRVYSVVRTNGEVEYWFNHANAIDGGCS